MTFTNNFPIEAQNSWAANEIANLYGKRSYESGWVLSKILFWFLSFWFISVSVLHFYLKSIFDDTISVSFTWSNNFYKLNVFALKSQLSTSSTNMISVTDLITQNSKSCTVINCEVYSMVEIISTCMPLKLSIVYQWNMYIYYRL